MTFTVPVLTTYTISSMVTEDSAILVARMILRTPTGELRVEMDQGFTTDKCGERGKFLCCHHLHSEHTLLVV